jgi:hypothetical protein
MYETIGNTITVPVRSIIDAGIISTPNYKKLVRQKRVKVVQRGCLGTPALADFSSFPERFRKMMENEWGDPKAERSTNALDQYLGQDNAAIEYFSSYEVDDDRYLPQDTITEYYSNACVLNAIHLLLNDRRSLQKMCGGKTRAFWPSIAQNVMDVDRADYPHSLPTNDRRLKERYKRYQKEGYESLIHKNFCNSNSAKIADDSQKALAIELLANPNNLDNAQVASLYNSVASGMNWKEITPAAVARLRRKYDTEIYAGRRGSTAFRNKKTMQIKRSAPTAPLYYWTMDGWDVELLYQKFENGRTSYHHRPTVVIVLDTFCKYPIGYAVGTHETPELIKAALRNAANHTEELFGGKYRSHQLQSDRYAIKAMMPSYEAMAKHITPARVKNAKAKIIEPYFNAINRKYCQLQANWSGFGITSDREKQPNVEYLNKYKSAFPDFEGACAQVAMIVEREREEKREQMLEAWSKVEASDKLELSTENYLMSFGITTGNRNLLEGSGLHITINGVKRSYDCFDLSFRKYGHVRWEVRFDPDDLSQVLAVNEDGSLRFMLEEKYTQPMALKDRKPGDSGQMQRVKDYNDQLEKQVTDFRAKQIEALGPVLEVLPQLDTLSKLLITDSKGQHKNNRNAGRDTASNSAKRALKASADDVEAADNPFELY